MQIVKLSDIVQQTDVVEVSKGVGLTLNPVPLSDVIRLFWEYQDSFISIFNQSQQEKAEYGAIALAAPEMVAQLIAISAGEPDSAAQVQKLDLTVQLIALGKIFKLTVPDAKKFAEVLADLVGELKKANATLVETQNVLESKTDKTSS